MAKRILVVDDEPDIRARRPRLGGHGHDVQTAANGDEAIRAASPLIPDLVLDIMMPDMDGFAVHERLRARPVDLRSPITLLTARREINDKLLGFEKGAADYITKPFHIKELLARVKVHLGELGPPKGHPSPPLTASSRSSGSWPAEDGQAGREGFGPSTKHGANHLHNVYHKLNVVDRAQAVIVSRENGWIWLRTPGERHVRSDQTASPSRRSPWRRSLNGPPLTSVGACARRPGDRRRH